MIDIKIIIGSAAAAVVFSLIAGIFGGVPFGLILLRMLLGGIIFAGIGAGIGFVLHKFVPELFDTPEDSEDETGANIDITVDDAGEEPAAEAPSNGRGEDENAEYPDVSVNFTAADADDDAAELDTADYTGEAEVIEEAEEVGEADFENIGETSNGGEDYDMVEEIAAADEDEDSSEGENNLPEMDQFNDSFVPVDEIDNGNAVKGFSSGDTVDIMGEEQDPAAVAKAVQTFLKKDQEG